MVAAGFVAGFATGGFPTEYSGPAQQLALILAMTFSLTEISFRGISPKREARGIGLSLLMNYGALGGLVLVFALMTADPAIRSGWVLMAVVPPAIAVVPITSFLKGDVRGSLISDAVLYLLGLVIIPALSLLLLGQAPLLGALVTQTLLLIGLPILLSRPLRLWKGIHEARPTAVSLAFFVLVFSIAGSTRDPLLGRTDLILSLSAFAFLRTMGLGFLVFGVTRILAIPRNDRIAAMTFAGFKNLGLTVVLAFTVFGPIASLPAIVSLVFEILWMGALPLLFRMPSKGLAEIVE